jgi:hypothetical protein
VILRDLRLNSASTDETNPTGASHGSRVGDHSLRKCSYVGDSSTL